MKQVCCWHPQIVLPVDGTRKGGGTKASCWKGYGTLTVQQRNKISQQCIDP